MIAPPVQRGYIQRYINLFREPAWERLDRMLIQPFIEPAHSYPINACEVDRVSSGEPSAKDKEEQN